MNGKRKLCDIWNPNSNSHTLVFLTFLFGVLGGCIGVLVDLDHLLYWAGFKGMGLVGRPLHVAMAIATGLFCLYCSTRLARLANKLVLKWIGIILLITIILVGLEILWAMFMWNV